MEAAGKRSDPRSVTPLLDVMERALAWGLAAGPRALGILGDHDAIFALENALESPHEGVRAAAAAALAALRARKSTPLLVRLLEDPEPEVTQAVVSALIQLGAGEALPQILPHVALEDDLVDALAEMKGGDALETCFQQAAAEPKDEVRVRTMRLCEALRESRERSGTTQSIRLSCGLKRLGSLGSQVRIVAPHRNGQAEAWTPAPGVDRGGVTLRLKPGERVRVQGALLDGTEIWLKVIDEWWLKESVSTLSDGAWMRERDLEERNAAPREDAASRGHR